MEELTRGHWQYIRMCGGIDKVLNQHRRITIKNKPRYTVESWAKPSSKWMWEGTFVTLKAAKSHASMWYKGVRIIDTISGAVVWESE